VLRAQYEKEGDYVGVQTKFNYAWVRISVRLRITFVIKLALKFLEN
jgi:fission 1 protein